MILNVSNLFKKDLILMQVINLFKEIITVKINLNGLIISFSKIYSFFIVN